MNTVESLLVLLDETDRRMRMLLDDLSDEKLDAPYHRGIHLPLGDHMDASRVDMNGVHMGQLPVDALPNGASSSKYLPYRQAYFPGRNDVFTGFRTCAV